MDELRDFLLNLLTQFAGGPGPPENNLVRFGLAAILWGTLLATAWSRARSQSRIRERLLVVGFSLALLRELVMLGGTSFKILTGIEHGPHCTVVVPAEQALALASIILITGAYLRYLLDDALLAKRYLVISLGATTLVTLIAASWWPQYLYLNPTAHFHETWLASATHLVGASLIAPVIAIVIWRRGWLGNVIAAALSLLFISEIVVYINFVTDRVFATWLCPLGNAIYLLAIPLFGYVYFHEQQNEQRRAEADLYRYRDHLEELVRDRTSEITLTNRQLQEEIAERKHAETELTRRNAELAAQNAIAATISHSQDLDAVLEFALVRTLDMLEMEHGCVMLLDPESGQLTLHPQQDTPSAEKLIGSPALIPLYVETSEQAIASMSPVIRTDRKPAVARTVCLSPEQASETVVSVPLISQNHALGALTLQTARASILGPEALKLLTAIGQQIGVAVEKSYFQRQIELSAALEERQRIAAEMHDGLAQTLSYLGLKTDYATGLLEEGKHDQAVGIFHQIRQVIDQATAEVRRSIASLQEGPPTRVSLQEAIRHTLDALTPAGMPTMALLDTLPEPIFLATNELGQVVRVVQEALTNALHHAQAQAIRVRLEATGNSLMISVKDDGRGFFLNAPGVARGEHFGLNIMRARAARLGGELTIDSEPGAGTLVTLHLPRMIKEHKPTVVSA